jgi:ABC-type polysaccharide/polyol phosphate transport system ATPase subunit
MIDIIKADNLGIYFKAGGQARSSLKDAVTGLFSKKRQADSFWVLRGVSFTVGRGEVLGVIGKSGTGKSTLLRVIGGIYPPDEGRLEVRGTVSALLSTTVGFQPNLSGVDNIYLNGILMGLKKKEIDARLDSIISFAEIGRFINMPVRTYTLDMYARLGFSITVHTRQDILLVDEALEAGDARFKQKSGEKMEELLSGGRTIILISHHLDTVRRYASKVIWIDDGKVVAQGEPGQIVNQYLSGRTIPQR